MKLHRRNTMQYWGKLLLSLILVAAFSLDAAADHHKNFSKGFNKSHHSGAGSTIKNKRMLSMSQAIAMAERRNNGQVLAARQSVNAAGETVYVIKILTKKGVVRKVRINAHR